MPLESPWHIALRTPLWNLRVSHPPPKALPDHCSVPRLSGGWVVVFGARSIPGSHIVDGTTFCRDGSVGVLLGHSAERALGHLALGQYPVDLLIFFLVFGLCGTQKYRPIRCVFPCLLQHFFLVPSDGAVVSGLLSLGGTLSSTGHALEHTVFQVLLV